MRIVDKPYHELQAQAAAYAETLPFEDRNELLTGIGAAATRQELDTAGTPEDHAGFVRYLGDTVRTGSRETIRVRAGLLAAYADFVPELGVIHSQARDGDYTTCQGYLAQGNHVTAVRFTHNDRVYVAKIPLYDVRRTREADDRIMDEAHGRGIPRFEQIVAVSYETGVSVVEFMQGEKVTELSVEMLQNITSEDLRGALDATARAEQRGGISIEDNPDNVLYDKKEGFSFVDYYHSRSPRATTASYMVQRFARVIADRGHVKQRPLPIDKRAFSIEVDQAVARVGVLRTLMQQCEEYEGGIYKRALLTIASLRQNLDEFIASSADDSWVSEQIGKNIDTVRRMALSVSDGTAA